MASKVPKFGSWENGDVGYTAYFEVARKGNNGGPVVNPNDIQMNQDVQQSNHNKPNPKPKQPQQPKFGAWDSGDEVPYTQYLEKKSRPIPNDQPQMNRDVDQPGKAPPKPSNNGPHPKPQGVKFVAAPSASERPQQKPTAPAGRGSSVPVFGGWNDNPAQAAGYTVVFNKLHEDKNKVNAVPTIQNPPRRHTNQPNYQASQPKKQSGWLACLFG